MIKTIFLSLLLIVSTLSAKEIALTFDDAPMPSTKHFTSEARTKKLIKKLKDLKVPPVMIFANPCKRDDTASVVAQLKKYTDAGHFIGNHTCTHPRLDDVGYDVFSKDAEKADKILRPLFKGKTVYFRFPYLNEGKDVEIQKKMRGWRRLNGYQDGYVSVDDDDYVFSQTINQAKDAGKKIDYKKVESLFVKHVMGAVNFYDDLAVKTLGRSPKHVLLLHEMDATVLFVDALVKELRAQGWTIISIEDAYKDTLYVEMPENTYANNGIVAQMATEKTGEKIGYNHYDDLKAELNKLLNLKFTDSK